MAAGHHALAEIDCSRQDWPTALDHLEHSLRLDTDNLRARNLKVVVLRKLATVVQASRLSAPNVTSSIKPPRRSSGKPWPSTRSTGGPENCAATS